MFQTFVEDKSRTWKASFYIPLVSRKQDANLNAAAEQPTGDYHDED
jgi:hypothetical protein